MRTRREPNLARDRHPGRRACVQCGRPVGKHQGGSDLCRVCATRASLERLFRTREPATAPPARSPEAGDEDGRLPAAA